MNLRLATLLALLALAAALILPLSIGAEPVDQPGSNAEPLSQPKIPHTLEGRDNCLACHGPGGLKPVPASHAGRNVATCRGCHQVASAGDAPQPTTVPIPVSTPVQAPITDVTQSGPTPQPINTAPTPQQVVTAPTAQAVTQAAVPAKQPQPVVAAQTTPVSAAPLPKTGDGDFLIAGGVALVLIVLGIGIRRFSAAG